MSAEFAISSKVMNAAAVASAARKALSVIVSAKNGRLELFYDDKGDLFVHGWLPDAELGKSAFDIGKPLEKSDPVEPASYVLNGETASLVLNGAEASPE
jgi:hypothetical protein